MRIMPGGQRSVFVITFKDKLEIPSDTSKEKKHFVFLFVEGVDLLELLVVHGLVHLVANQK